MVNVNFDSLVKYVEILTKRCLLNIILTLLANNVNNVLVQLDSVLCYDRGSSTLVPHLRLAQN